ncbi:MAG TPA: DUF423 domain-containing protein [Deinococcales bacterium]|nr:DUF423 domain-containing protein [Deinococcales bacterium]
MTDRSAAGTGAVLAALATALGAFGAHVLEGAVSADRLDTFETAARYLMYGALGLLLLSRLPGTGLARSLVLAGAAVFSGSLVILVLTDTGWLGAVTPFGGVLMIAGWLTAAWQQFRGGRTS